jgi:hypothetical protein
MKTFTKLYRWYVVEKPDKTYAVVSGNDPSLECLDWIVAMDDLVWAQDMVQALNAA